MSRYYLHYRFRLEEPMIISDGSQIGNVLTTRDFIPGSTMLGLCANLYLRKKGCQKIHRVPEFRDLFLSEKTIFSPAYPVAGGSGNCFPTPYSVFGCKYHGFNSPKPMGRTMHGISDCLCNPIPKICPEKSCGEPMEHKGGYCYFKGSIGPFTHEVSRRIITHNRVAHASKDKELFSFETLTEGQEFYGEISFSEEHLRDTLCDLLKENPVVKLGKARQRGYGRVEIYRPVKKDKTCREPWRDGVISGDGIFSLYLFSDAIVLNKALNYCSRIDKNVLGSVLDIDPGELEVYSYAEGDRYRSFWKTGILMGFNQKRQMPLPMECTISRGSVFTVHYKNGADISGKLETLMEKGIGIRRNEGFGQVIINLKTQKLKPCGEDEEDATS